MNKQRTGGEPSLPNVRIRSKSYSTRRGRIARRWTKPIPNFGMKSSRCWRKIPAERGVLDRPAAGLLEDSTVTTLAAGAQLEPYKIEASVGAGGMGEVYRAIDTRPDSPVIRPRLYPFAAF